MFWSCICICHLSSCGECQRSYDRIIILTNDFLIIAFDKRQIQPNKQQLCPDMVIMVTLYSVLANQNVFYLKCIYCPISFSWNHVCIVSKPTMPQSILMNKKCNELIQY